MAEPALVVAGRGPDGGRLDLVVAGDLDLQSEAHVVDAVLPLAARASEVRVDCCGCTFADVRGAGLLARLGAGSATVVLVEPPQQLEWVLLQTGTWSAFRIEGSHFPELTAEA